MAGTVEWFTTKNAGMDLNVWRISSKQFFCMTNKQCHRFADDSCLYNFRTLHDSQPQNTHSVATAALWRLFQHDGKLSPAWWRWVVHAYPLSLCLPSRTTLQCGVSSSWEGLCSTGTLCLQPGWFALSANNPYDLHNPHTGWCAAQSTYRI